MAIAEGIAATRASLEVAKFLVDKLSGPSIDVNDVRSKVNELLIHVVNAQVALGDAQVEISELRQQLDKLASSAALTADMEFQLDGGFYIRKSEAERGLIPYCPVCWQKDKVTIPLKADGVGAYWCTVHTVTYRTSKHVRR